VALRCFEYASRLVVAVAAAGPDHRDLHEASRPRELVFQQRALGRVVNQWSFDVVRLWERKATEMLALGREVRRSWVSWTEGIFG